MSKDKNPPIDAETQALLDIMDDLCEKTMILPEEIRHVILANGQEFFGQLVEIDPETIDEEQDAELKADLEMFKNSGETIYFFPMKIVHEGFLSNDGNFFQSSTLEPYSGYALEPFIPLHKNSITTSLPVNLTTVVEYLKKVYEEYFGGELDQEVKLLLPKDNVVSFQDFKDKKAAKKKR